MDVTIDFLVAEDNKELFMWQGKLLNFCHQRPKIFTVNYSKVQKWGLIEHLVHVTVLQGLRSMNFYLFIYFFFRI